MAETDVLLEGIREGVPGCIAALLMSVEEGVVGVMAGEALDAEGVGAVAAAGRDLFALGGVAGDSREMVVLSDRRIYVYRRLAARPALILAAICGETSNLGLFLGMVRQALEQLEGVR